MIRSRKARLSVGIVLGVAALTAPLAALSGSASAAPAAAAGSAVYHGTVGSAKRLAQAASISSLPTVALKPGVQGPRVLTPIRFKGTSTVGAANAATAGATPLGDLNGASRAFNGLSDLDQANLNGGVLAGTVTPPDQGLCVGRDTTLAGSPKAVFEPINDAVRETSTSGALLRSDASLATLFQDPFAEGDVRCLYDAQTQSFYFTEIGYPVATGPVVGAGDPLPFNTVADVVVVNKNGAAAYQFDTSLGGTCFGDQPKTGFDNNALVISTDEYCGANETEIGAIAVVISKPQLVAQDSTVNDAVVGPVSLAGNPVVGMAPAIGTGSGTAYFVNSVPFLPDGSNNPVGDTLGLWTLTNSASVTTGSGSVTLTSAVLPSEPYAFPVLATSTGDGSVTTVDGIPITSEAALNPDDSRLSGPVEVTRGFGGIQLWTALDAAVTPGGTTTAQDAAAWFRIDVGSQRVGKQGYVTAKGANLLYPAIGAPQFGDPEMVFTITSKKINPSAAYTVLGSKKITTVAAGTGPHLSFADAPPFNSPRWGDYSFAQVDPDGTGVWLATEYIPSAADQNPLDNWGTYVFEVKPFSFGY
jgi:hypothetical protein